jgi:hypothetical protein
MSTFRSVRDARRLAKASLDFYADMTGRPRQDYAVPAKRIYTKSKSAEPSEHQVQAAVIAWWAHACKWHRLPPFVLLAIPNGGARDAITGARLKAEGVRPGVPDLFMAVSVGACSGLFLELKRRGGSATPAQLEILDYLDGAGYKTAVTDTFEAAIAIISGYLNGQKA